MAEDFSSIVSEKFIEFCEKKCLYTDERKLEFSVILKFLHSIEPVYMPYGKSGAGSIQISGDVKEWLEKKRSFRSKEELDLLELKIEDVAKWYKRFSEASMHLLGGGGNDWMQLWKNITWEKKDKLEGDVRLGIEFLQLSLMLKRFIEEHLGREILDVDEMTNISEHDVLKYLPEKMDQYGILLRASRNRDYTDPKDGKNYYCDRYKMRFYLANKFGLDYQPRVMLFVEGKTEEEVLPRFFEWHFGMKPEDLGIEIVNFKGVDKLLSTAKIAEELKKTIVILEKDAKEMATSKTNKQRLNSIIKELKNTDIIVSNWTSFLSYNLEKWQIIPFFLSDDEGNIKHFLEAKTPLKFNGKNYNLPEEWKYLWGLSNKNRPFEGKDFEFANFSDEEIALAISEVLDDEIDIEKVKTVRDKRESINKIHPDVKPNKVKIGKRLVDNLFENYKRNNDQYILKRPVFDVIEKIGNMAILNHLPVDREMEIRNKEQIKKWLGPSEENE